LIIHYLETKEANDRNKTLCFRLCLDGFAFVNVWFAFLEKVGHASSTTMYGQKTMVNPNNALVNQFVGRLLSLTIKGYFSLFLI